MINLISDVISQSKIAENSTDLNDVAAFLNEYKFLYDNSNKEFYKECSICERISNFDSYCYCWLLLSDGNRVGFQKRSEIRGFIITYNELEKKLQMNNSMSNNSENNFESIQKSTKELEKIFSSNDFELFERKVSHYNLLFENANITFFNTCSICYEINNNNSFCSCDVSFNNEFGSEKIKRVDLKNYMEIFQSVYKKSNLTQLKNKISKIEDFPFEEQATFESMKGLPAPIKRDVNNESQNNIIQRLTQGFKNQLEKHPTVSFNGMMAAIADKVGHEQVDKGFDLYAEAWNKVSINKVSDNDIKEVYENMFGSQDIDLSNLTENTQESKPTIETPAIEKTLEPKVENEESSTINNEIRFFEDIFLPVGTYLAIMQFSILNFISRFFIDLNENINTFYILCAGIAGFFYLKMETGRIENIRIKFFRILFSEKSQEIHFYTSIVIVLITNYETTIFLSMIIGVILILAKFTVIKDKLNKSLLFIWRKIIDVLGYKN